MAEHLGDDLRAEPTEGHDHVITGIGDDSRTVQPGDLYVALPGRRFHGLDFEEEAAARGAVAVLSDRPSRRLPTLLVDRPRERVGALASWIFGHPSQELPVYGVTGTNGKTSATYLLDAALAATGLVTGLIGGVVVRGPAGACPATRTTPEAAVVQRTLAGFRDQGVGAVTMEVSSHAVSQHRVDGVRFRTVAFTNLARDHLDFHGTMERYFAAKAALFTAERTRAAVVNVDDEYGRRLRAAVNVPVWTHSMRDPSADVYADAIRCDLAGTAFTVHTPVGSAPVRLSLLGPHQVANALTALTSIVAAGGDVVRAAAGLETLAGVPGRLERVESGRDVLALVDYMHNTAGQHELLPFLRSLAPERRLILVISATGERDPGKRFPLGHTAATYADVVVVTDDSPLSEDPHVLREAVAEGAFAANGARVIVEADRRRAFEIAASCAGPGDVIVAAGRGCEPRLVAGETVRAFDDRDELRRALRRHAAARAARS
ncbi:UDP-N-acetylmuramoyl-L-alanyl-D-glutamate--2,6-diaminopimelate ligase [Rhodococcus sp. Z13]|uniref:UDP-N-acetylmuramoyl-L-alanyl-D-glutamate--2, 6-diaminopimelate ligase n=1 Tax=Rhodococcus sacchari TaxID=2962047 RepID=A0ACD4DLG9_9NOCA|nr:UDP-N-acetylmuramoyl-L-alanyl-D-glutamate--2,6-diaminopimelate ligase [Rhodococcus sp. Z13]UYP20885.1 UDP-N-acetylmuramoyl-L-alanyl-D-glutamate--2,6-diaminopimelate ligase [Rhodococcus sp. Z13]